MSTVNNHRVVVRRKRSSAKAHHGGSWKIAYADFITAMMAFFLVMWLVSIVPREELKGIADYFRMPLRVALTGGPNSSAETSAIPGGGSDPLRSKGEVRRADGNRVEAQPDADRRDRHRLESLKRRLEAVIDNSPVLKNFRPQLLIDLTTEGLRIQIVDSQNRPMFATGSAQVQPYMRDILRELGPVLNDLPNKVSISGHTDATQYARRERAYSNWELSTDRANASRQELVAGGMTEGKVMRIQGLASSMSIVKDDPYAAVNRRISLVVLNEKTQRRIEAENAAAADVSSRDAQEVGQAVTDHNNSQGRTSAGVTNGHDGNDSGS
ncbi:flagellar motor protein MotB [Bordetella avium]|uniref:Chemotaxis protein n=1 Tax=Bordetella avium (strain 197N) TaxID=360910 RepID=Q2L1E0_BORA1|nr:flagellar motor protein MotB [Bordetella avium]AZY49052.1 motility protein MotB [Bordetella avium]AZY52411.1 motility protein MotB [Bordetella avium]RIQ18167.1 motility protein MotB [Bordetella avium]RIQ36638.1 motility protein MotB [Bordetella avium]RIQ50021.1 motility protein MotB [Bordetella avium]